MNEMKETLWFNVTDEISLYVQQSKIIILESNIINGMYWIKLLALLPLLVLCKGEDELLAVTALIRHGERIPLSFYPTDPYNNFTWPYVLGDLTNEGVREMYHVGQWLRKKYSKFLSEIYKPDEVYAHSVDFERCYMTGEATFAGLYPPVGQDVWNRRIRWQPVPIHGSPNNQDIETNMLEPCPGKYEAVSELIFNSTEYPAIIKKYGGLLDYITKMSGQNYTLPSLYAFFDTLFSEKALGLPLPKWAEEIYPQIESLIVLYTKLNSMTPVEIEVQIGPLVTQILNQFQRAISREDFGNPNTIYRKFMVYISTEWMLYDFTYGLGLEGIGIPKYGALYLVELRRNSKKGYYVDILYRNSSVPGTKAVPWRFKGTGYSPSFESFRRYLEPMRTNTTQWVPMCKQLTGLWAKTATGVPIS